jgi:hypothetical protein
MRHEGGSRGPGAEFPDMMMAARAKAFASGAAILVVSDALKIFGARGYGEFGGARGLAFRRGGESDPSLRSGCIRRGLARGPCTGARRGLSYDLLMGASRPATGRN